MSIDTLMKKLIENINLESLKLLASELAKTLKPQDVVCLYGDLGSGKTTLSGFIINSLLEVPQAITSPTFNLVHTYDTSKGRVWHFDLYRLKKPDELYELGIDDALSSGISLIEWPELAESMLPNSIIKIHLYHNKNGEFCVEIS